MQMILGSTIAAQALGEYRVMVKAGLNAGLTPVEIKEVLYHCVPYVGVAKAFDFLHATNEVFQDNGICLPLEGRPPPHPKTASITGLPCRKRSSAI